METNVLQSKQSLLHRTSEAIAVTTNLNHVVITFIIIANYVIVVASCVRVTSTHNYYNCREELTKDMIGP